MTLSLYVGRTPAGVDAPADDNGDGFIDPGQTFDLSGEALVTVGGAIIDGRLKAGPADVPMNLPTASFTFNLENAHVRFSLEGTDATSGLIAGGVDAEELIVMLTDVEGLPVSEAVVRSFVETAADLEPRADGKCTAVSMALTFEAVSAVRGTIGG